MRRSNVTFLSCMLVLTCLAASAAFAGDVGLWMLDGNAVDLSGNGNNGVLQGTAGYTITTPLTYGGNRALSTGAEGNVRIPNSGSLAFTNAITIEAWIYPTQVNRTGRIVCKDGDVFGFRHAGQALQFWLKSGGGVTLVQGTTRLTFNRWYHVAATWDKSVDGGKLKIYVNGQLETLVQDAYLTGDIDPSAGDMYISFFHAAESFRGYIDEVRVRDTSATATDIQADYQTSLHAANPRGPVMQYNFDGNGNDSTGNGNNASLLGDAAYAASSPFGGADNRCLQVTAQGGAAVGYSSSMAITDAITIEAWVYPVNPSGYRRIVYKGNDAFCLRMADANVQFYLISNGNLQITTGASPLSANTWHHVAGVWSANANGGALSIYVDGQLIPSSSASLTDPLTQSADPVFVSSDSPETFQGKIDEVRVSNMALNPSDIAFDYLHSVRCKEIGAGAVATWLFDNNAADSTDFGNTGTVVGNAAFSSNVRFPYSGNKSLDLTAAGSAVHIPYSESLGISNAITLQAWILPTSLAGYGRIVWKGDDSYVLRTAGEGIQFYLKSGGAVYLASTTVPVQGLAWNHVAATWDKSLDNGNLKIYINGQPAPLAAQVALIGYVDQSRAGDLIGNAGGEAFAGYVDEIKISNVAASAADILADYQYSLHANAPGLVGEWLMDGTFADSSGNSNNGTSFGDVSFTSNTAGQKPGSQALVTGVGMGANVAYSGSLKITDAVTLEAWVYSTGATSTDNIGRIIAKKDDTYALRLRDQQFEFYAKSGDVFTFVTASTPLEMYRWYHVAATWDKSRDGGKVKLYVNGQPVALVSEQHLTTGIDQSTADVSISWNSAEGLNGMLDDVRIYNMALADSDILGHYTASAPGKKSIVAAKGLADNTLVSLTGIVSAAFDGFFYVADVDRTAGIRVSELGFTAKIGKTVDVTGYMTTSDMERCIDASSVIETADPLNVLQPFFMNSKAVGGAAAGGGQVGAQGGYGLNNVGLLIRLAGRVTDKDPSLTPLWFNIDDGSGIPVKVYGVVPAGSPMVTVTGISSLDSLARRALLAVDVQSVAD